MNGLVVLFQLLIVHALCDYPLQGEAIAKGKNRHNPPFGIPPGQTPVAVWWHYLTAHALIHAGGVWLVTGIVWLGLVELVVHWWLDFAKCENITDPHQDQLFHVVTKCVYAGIVGV